MRHKRYVLLFAVVVYSYVSFAQTSMPLYSGKIPNSIGGEQRVQVNTIAVNGTRDQVKTLVPMVDVYPAPATTANGAAIVICPGGSYNSLSLINEGSKIAEAFNAIGVTAFVLRYRMPDSKTMVDKTIGPLQDVQSAILMVRQKAALWHIDTARVGIIGFSAGGHLASTAGTHFKQKVIENPGGISLRPDFMLLVYPVINLSDSLMHKVSRNNLIGDSPSAELTRLYSKDLQVTPQTPPTFLVHAGDDKVVKVGNSLRFYEALLKNNIPGELHIYPTGGHGFGLNKNNWMPLAESWLRHGGWIK